MAKVDKYQYDGKILTGTSADIKKPTGAGKILTSNAVELDEKTKNIIQNVALDAANKSAEFALEALLNIKDKDDRERFVTIFGKHYGELAARVIVEEAEQIEDDYVVDDKELADDN